ncbi:hypothetical protein OR16_04297 [Cupriavidus basilensis OR16]|uniref:Uncharacterized protein n=1 Tax=Cupriavidus basilensis OR16 TaxID=1127483 RepID=H1RZV3_9BURK|nr:hypothetical protein [Cupriavidus basilensis]EHP44169.1 hypothetical protein OR16_04297 [Cupriavidus basilensis OR16]
MRENTVLSRAQSATVTNLGGSQGASAEADLKAVYDAFGISAPARTLSVLLACIDNVRRHAECLHAIECEFIMVPGEPDDAYPDDERNDESPLYWGASPEQYVEQFRKALQTIAAPRPSEDKRDTTAAARAALAECGRQVDAEGPPPAHDERLDRAAIVKGEGK